MRIEVAGQLVPSEVLRHVMRATSSDQEVKRMCSVAITEAQTAQMWAVKAVTWK